MGQILELMAQNSVTVIFAVEEDRIAAYNVRRVYLRILKQWSAYIVYVDYGG